MVCAFAELHGLCGANEEPHRTNLSTTECCGTCGVCGFALIQSRNDFGHALLDKRGARMFKRKTITEKEAAAREAELADLRRRHAVLATQVTGAAQEAEA